jgi:hypothetical protein
MLSNLSLRNYVSIHLAETIVYVNVANRALMRVWDCDPKLLCDKHLRAQHAEIHFAIRVIENGWKTRWKDIERFRNHPNGVQWLSWVHEATVLELQNRGQFKTHASFAPKLRPFYRDLLQWYWIGNWSNRYLYTLVMHGYPLTKLNQGTPWERDKVSKVWYLEHHHDWTKQLALNQGKKEKER